MAISDVITLLTGLLGLFGTILFCIGIIEVSKPDLIWLATRAWGAGKQVALGMKAQQVDFIFGLTLIFLSFALQAISIFFSAADQLLSDSKACSASLVISFFTLFIIFYFAVWYAVRKRALNKLELEIIEKEEAPSNS